MAITIGIPKETAPSETRVALVPAVVSVLKAAGADVHLENHAGKAAGFSNEDFAEKGAAILSDRKEVLRCDIVLHVRAYGANQNGLEDLKSYQKGQTIIGHCDPLGNSSAVKAYAEMGVNLVSMEMIPRISRAQSMDALSSQANLAGYKSVILAATHLPKIFPMMMTAAGSIRPARVFVIGAGVAGLQAIATARRLGAVVEGYDVRPEVKEQVESLGAKFVVLEIETKDSSDTGGYAKAQGDDFYKKQQELMKKVVAGSDVVITTAAIPGRKSPVLVTTPMVEAMQPGSVIVDLAAERGGNCELSKADETVQEYGVTVLGPTNLPATLPHHASQLYAKNISTLLLHLMKDGKLEWNLEDEITKGCLVASDGKVTNARIAELLSAGRA